MTRLRPHVGPLGLFAAIAVVWTWPLAMHLTSAIPGWPGDNYRYIWSAWWMRDALATPGASFFQTDRLFFPFGANLVNHNHAAFDAFIGATVFARLPIAAATNVMILVHLFLNCAVTYGLVWSVTRHPRAAIFAGVLFGASPYLAAHLRGHFDLMAAWVLPAFAWALWRALTTRSVIAASVAGLMLGVTAYVVYYYVVFILLLAAAYTIAWIECLEWLVRPRLNPSARVVVRRVVIVLLVTAASASVWVVITGGAVVSIFGWRVSIRQPQNLLTATWILSFFWWLLGRHVRLRFRQPPAGRVGTAVLSAAVVAIVFLTIAFPLIRQGVRLMRSGEYVSQTYFWRSAPRGVDAVAPVLGHPFHPLTGDLSSRAYEAIHADRIEAIGWLGIIPVALLIAMRVDRSDRAEAHRWWAVAAVGAVWAVGPMLRIVGADVGAWMPEVLARFIPFVENARMPGRGFVIVYLALAMLAAMRLRAAGGRWQTPAVQWLLIAGLAIDFADMPIPRTTLAPPPALERLASRPPGAVCNVPFAIGDGLRVIGPPHLDILYDATIHRHPVVGGFLSRMPAGAPERYAAMPVVGDLLRMSGGGTIVPVPSPAGTPSPCTYLVVKRSSATAEQLRYVETGPFEKIDGDDSHEIYVVRRESDNR